MSNLTSENDYNFSGEESPEHIQPGKYIKKLKTYKKKGHKMISSTLKKKGVNFTILELAPRVHFVRPAIALSQILQR